MFENLLNRGKKEEEQQTQAEGREREFVRERDLFNSANVQNADMEYMQMQESRSDLLKWQQDLDDELEKLKHKLRGETKTEEGWKPKVILVRDANGKVVQAYSPPLANDLFIDYIETQVEPFLSRNLLNSNFSEKRILEILKNTMNDVCDVIADGWDLFGIEFINYDLVIRLIKNTIIPGPFRAMNDGERRHQRTISKRIEAFQDSTQPIPQKKGLFGGFKNG